MKITTCRPYLAWLYRLLDKMGKGNEDGIPVRNKGQRYYTPIRHNTKQVLSSHWQLLPAAPDTEDSEDDQCEQTSTKRQHAIWTRARTWTVICTWTWNKTRWSKTTWWTAPGRPQWCRPPPNQDLWQCLLQWHADRRMWTGCSGKIGLL